MSPMAKPSNELLDAKRLIGDPVADAVVTDLIEGGHIDEVDRDLLALLRNEQPLPPNLPPSLHDYLELTTGPVEVSTEALIRGQNVYADLGRLRDAEKEYYAALAIQDDPIARSELARISRRLQSKGGR